MFLFNFHFSSTSFCTCCCKSYYIIYNWFRIYSHSHILAMSIFSFINFLVALLSSVLHLRFIILIIIFYSYNIFFFLLVYCFTVASLHSFKWTVSVSLHHSSQIFQLLFNISQFFLDCFLNQHFNFFLTWWYLIFHFFHCSRIIESIFISILEDSPVPVALLPLLGVVIDPVDPVDPHLSLKLPANDVIFFIPASFTQLNFNFNYKFLKWAFVSSLFTHQHFCPSVMSTCRDFNVSSRKEKTLCILIKLHIPTRWLISVHTMILTTYHSLYLIYLTT